MNYDLKIVEKLKIIFENVGVYLEEDDLDERIEINSLQFVNIIIKIEEEFLLRISSERYDYSELISFRDYLDMINSYIY